MLPMGTGALFYTMLHVTHSATYLLNQGVSPSAKDIYGRTPAHYLANQYDEDAEEEDALEDTEGENEEETFTAGEMALIADCAQERCQTQR